MKRASSRWVGPCIVGPSILSMACVQPFPPPPPTADGETTGDEITVGGSTSADLGGLDESTTGSCATGPVAGLDGRLVVSGEAIFADDVLDNDCGAGLRVADDSVGEEITALGRLHLYQDGTFFYEPHEGAWGTDELEYTVVDEAGCEATASIVIVVRPVEIELWRLDADEPDGCAPDCGLVIDGRKGAGGRTGASVVGGLVLEPGGVPYVAVGSPDLVPGTNTLIDGETLFDFDGITVDDVALGMIGGYVLAAPTTDVVLATNATGPADFDGDGRSDLAFDVSPPASIFRIQGLELIALDDPHVSLGGLPGSLLEITGLTGTTGLYLTSARSRTPAGLGAEQLVVVDPGFMSGIETIGRLSAIEHGTEVVTSMSGTATNPIEAPVVSMGRDLAELDERILVKRGSGVLACSIHQDGTGQSTWAQSFVLGPGPFEVQSLAGDPDGANIDASADVDGNHADFVVGATGRAYVVFGQDWVAEPEPSLAEIEAGEGHGYLIVAPAMDQAAFGKSVAVWPDLDGDGAWEVVVGGSDRLYVTLGRSDVAPFDAGCLWPEPSSCPPDQRGFVITGEPGDELGAPVRAGDLDGDGLEEWLIGVPGANGGDGRVYVLRGIRWDPPPSDAACG